jgi:D-inositol-3-phosphate glycosyltransferase
MHIALVHHHVGGKAGGGGGVRLMLELGSGLVKRGHRVTIACHDYLPTSEFAYAADQLEIRSVRRGVSELPAGNRELARRFWLDMPKVARLVPADADVVNAHEWLALRPGRIASRRLSIPLVWTRNDESLWERAIVPKQTITGDRPPLRRAVQALLTWPDLLDARRASAIVVLSAQQVDMVRRSYRKDALVVPVGPPAHFFDPPDRAAARARLGIPDEVFLVVGSGILVEHRRFEDLIDTMSLLTDDPQIHALIAGSDHVDPAYADRLAAQIAARDLAARVTLPRRSLSDAELKDTYAAADVFVILSQRYAWGLAPLEAIASGAPVILTPGAGVYDVLAGRPGVQAVPAQDPQATADAIRRWRSGVGRQGLESTREWLREEFAFDNYVARMEQIYTDVLGADPRGRRGFSRGRTQILEQALRQPAEPPDRGQIEGGRQDREREWGHASDEREPGKGNRQRD